MQVSFEDSLRLSQLPQNSSPIKKKQDKKRKTVQFEQDDILKELAPDAKQSLPRDSKRSSIADGKLDFIFNPARDITTQKPYHEDGNSEMYTEQALQTRMRLKQDPEIKTAITDFMRHYKLNKNERLSKDEYLKVMIRIAFLLRDDIIENEELEDLRFTLFEDWEHDSHGQGYMTKEDIYESLFELADIWTPDAEKEEYLGFFEILNERFQYQPNEKIEQKYYEIIGEMVN